MEEKIERARAILKTGPRSAEETLGPSDPRRRPGGWRPRPSTSSASSGSGTCATGVEQVLAAGDPADAYVAEAASWTLAACAAAERAAPRNLDGRAAGDGARRFGSASCRSSRRSGVDELFRMTRAGHQTRPEAGVTVLREGASPEELHLLVDGEAVAVRRGTETRRIAAPAALGFQAALAGRRAEESIRTIGRTVLVTFSDGALRTLLSDNIDLVQGILRMAADARSVPRGVIKGAPPAELESFSGSLTAAQKGLALRRIPLFAKVSGVETLHLAAVAKQVEIEPGAVFTDQTAPLGVGIVLAGELDLRTADDSRRTVVQAAPGDVLGEYGMLVGEEARTQEWQAVATRTCSILWVEREEFFDLLGQRPGLLQQIFAAAEEPPPSTRSPGPGRDAARGSRDAAGLDETR